MKKAFNIAACAVLGLYVTIGGAACLRDTWKMHNIKAADPAGRALTAGEIKMAQGVFGDGIDYSRVRLHKAPAAGDLAVTDGNDIYLESAAMHGSDFSAPGEKLYRKKGLIHELTHVWQHQKMGRLDKIWMQARTAPKRVLYVLTGSGLLYDAPDPDKKFPEMNQEQQAVAVADFFAAEAILDSPDCAAVRRDYVQSVVCTKAREQIDSLVPRIRPALPLPGARTQ